MKHQPLLESLSDTLIVYMFLKKLTTPFEEWDAFQHGIIDKNGKKLKEPKTSEEKRSWTVLDKFVWNLKKLMHKFVGKSKIGAYVTAAYLLKDSVTVMLSNSEQLLEELLTINDNLSYTQKKQLHQIISSINIKSFQPIYEINKDIVNKILVETNKINKNKQVPLQEVLNEIQRVC